MLPRPEYVPDDKPISLYVRTEKYAARVQGRIVYVKQTGGDWRYSAKITEMDAENQRQYMQIVYDRMHSLPTKLDTWGTASDDLLMNALRRAERQSSDMRALPRIKLQMPAKLNGKTRCTIVDFNHRFALVETDRKATLEGPQRLPLADGLALELVNPKPLTGPDGQERCLFEVANWQHLVYNSYFARLLDEWMARRSYKPLPGNWTYRKATDDVLPEGSKDLEPI